MGIFKTFPFLTLPFRVQLNVAGYEFFGQADLPQTAKHNAASQVRTYPGNLALKAIYFLGNGSSESFA